MIAALLKIGMKTFYSVIACIFQSTFIIVGYINIWFLWEVVPMADKGETEQKISQINGQLEMLINDMSVPKNVRNAIVQAKEKLNSNGEYSVRISSAIYGLDSVSNDVNLPLQARTMIWSALSILESIKG